MTSPTGRPDPAPQIQNLTTCPRGANPVSRMFRPGGVVQIEQVHEPGRSSSPAGSVSTGQRVRAEGQWGTVVHVDTEGDLGSDFVCVLTIMPLHPNDTFAGTVSFKWWHRLATRE